MSKHTPGPWEVAENDDEFECVDIFDMGLMAIIDDLGDPVAHVESWVDDGDDKHEEAMANARLIAAAPDLLSACEMMLDQLKCDYLEPDGERWSYALEAIAKATGGVS